jgi:cyclic pyranopterin phosphate synthase
VAIDGFGRKIDYLRLSVTDRCNFRCSYCLPVVYGKFQASENILSDDEIVYLVESFADQGFSKIRITGGEPLVRPDICKLISRISKVNGISDVSMTTNGMFLARDAKALASAGLRRVNVSMDTMDPARFEEITRYGKLQRVLDGLEAAVDAGLGPVKINCVVARGMNGDEISEFASLTEKRPLHVRFIELMPMGETGFFSKEKHLPLLDMMEAAGPLEELSTDDRPLGNGPARYYRRPGAQGSIGFISALSCGFCETCNRVRLSATGVLVPCLDGEDGVDLRSPLRANVGRKEIRRIIADTIEGKPERHHMVERAAVKSENPRFMCQIGG